MKLSLRYKGTLDINLLILLITVKELFMQPITIKGIVFPAELFGKKIKNWTHEQRLLIVQARTRGASIFDIADVLDIQYHSAIFDINHFIPQASSTPQAILEKLKTKLTELSDYGEPLTAVQVAELYEIKYTRARLLLSYLPVWTYRNNNPQFKPLTCSGRGRKKVIVDNKPVVKTEVKNSVVATTKTDEYAQKLSKSDVEELRHLHYTIDLAQQRIATILAKYED